MDILFVEKIPYLISVTEPLSYILVNKLKDRSIKKILYKQVYKQLGVYFSRGFDLLTIRCDPESELVGLKSLFGHDGIEMDITGADEAVPKVERTIRTVKERVRGILNTLPYCLLLKFLPYLLFFCVLRINMTPYGDRVESPFEQLYGRKLDYRKNMKANFGDYVQAHRNKIDNTMK
eukprot:gene7081-14411_t